MLRNVDQLKGFQILATDGEIGRIDEFYFDDASWTIRYLVVDTGPWLLGRKVLVSPTALGQIGWASQTLSVSLTKTQVENSPDIDTNKPVSRQQETDLANHYNWVPYWAEGGLAAPVITPQSDNKSTLEKEIEALKEKRQDPHLRSTNEVIGYHIQASDGEIGHVEDFMVDEASWAIHYMVVNTRNWLPGKSVLISPEWIEAVGWNEKKVRVDLSKEEIKTSPEYDPKAPIDRAYETELYSHYNRPYYFSLKNDDNG